MSYLALTRPRQWPKNLFVLAGVFFSRSAGEAGALALALAGTLCFVLLSAAVYAFNDITDLDTDRADKPHRPLPSGRVSVRGAALTSALLASAGLALAYALDPRFALVGLAFICVNVLYSLWLKRVPVVDAVSVAVCFLLRAFAGAELVRVPLSSWLALATIFVALFIAFAKRRSERRAGFGGGPPYDERALESLVTASATLSVVTYALYAISVPGRWAWVTTLFVVFGVFRYLHLAVARGAPPEETILTDVPLLVTVGLWALSLFVLLYVL